jgi:hypothetical protein
MPANAHARTHRRRQSNLLHERALGAGRLCLDDGIHERLRVLEISLLFAEARLADAGVDDAGLLDAELDGAALGVLDGRRRHPW